MPSSRTSPASLARSAWGCVYDTVLKRAVAASVRVRRSGEGEEITTPALREVRVQWALQLSAIRMVMVARGGAEPEWLPEYLEGVKARTDRTYDETVREAVTLYRIAATVNLAPLKLVSDQLGVSVSTATRMMARAREAGLGVDLITRETYNRIRADEDRMSAPHQVPGGQRGPRSGADPPHGAPATSIRWTPGAGGHQRGSGRLRSIKIGIRCAKPGSLLSAGIHHP